MSILLSAARLAMEAMSAIVSLLVERQDGEAVPRRIVDAIVQMIEESSVRLNGSFWETDELNK